jgi:hypothetical protein
LKRAPALLRCAATGALAAALALAAAAPTQAAVSEAQIKAAYLYKLASFVRWPPSAFTDQAAPLRICVAGRNDVYGVVEALARGQQASGRQLAAASVDLAHPENVASCQILFVGRGDAAARALLAEVAQRPVLTVTDRSAGARGGIIEFVPTGGNVRFSIHRRAAEARQLVLSSKLLAVAASVEP